MTGFFENFEFFSLFMNIFYETVKFNKQIMRLFIFALIQKMLFQNVIALKNRFIVDRFCPVFFNSCKDKVESLQKYMIGRFRKEKIFIISKLDWIYGF